MLSERLFCFTQQTQFSLEHGGVYLVTIDKRHCTLSIGRRVRNGFRETTVFADFCHSITESVLLLCVKLLREHIGGFMHLVDV